MKKLFQLILAGAIFTTGLLLGSYLINKGVGEKTRLPQIIKRPLEKYELENLMDAAVPIGKIKISKVLDETNSYTSSEFEFTFSPTLEEGKTKMTTGMINIPSGEGPFPIVVMFRGYADQEIYTTGLGTKNAATYFANNGFITIAPDFLGYAGSDSEAGNVFETRFQTYTTAISLFESLDEIEDWDKNNVFIWAHSNGGQITLTSFVAKKYTYPAALWAPVTKPFPYAILYYTDESEDRGKFIRNELAAFEEVYDVEKFTYDNYLDRIAAPLLIHQGTADDAVPLDWSNNFTKKLEALEIEHDYKTYTGADHNMKPVWNSVIQVDLKFFLDNLI